MAKEKIEWVKLITRPQTGLTLDFVVRGIGAELPKLVGIGLDIRCELRGEEGTGIVFEGAESRKRLNAVLEEKQKKDGEFFYDHIIKGRKRANELIKVSNDINNSDLGVKDEKLQDYWIKYRDVFCQYTPFLHTVFAPEAILTKRLREGIKSCFPQVKEEKLEEYFRILTTVEYDSDFYLEQKDLFEIAIDRQAGKDMGEGLLRHAKRFGYMGLTNSFLSKQYDRNHFQALIDSIQNPKVQLNKLVQGRKKELSKYKDFIGNLPKELLDTAKILQLYMIFRTERIVALKSGQDNIKPLLKKIGKTRGVSLDEIIWYQVSEIDNLLKGGDKIDVTKRREYFVIELVDGETYYSEEYLRGGEQERATELRGMVAHPGTVKGRVRLVFTREVAQELKEGEVLVTTMTTPDLVIAIRKAAAIITDEGGVLCHAAIVSREFGIPCIIGTNIATKILRDGDLVEVDAEKGVVKILKRAK